MRWLLEPWRTRLLWLSLGLNLFGVAGLGAPLVLHRAPPGPPGLDRAIGHLAEALQPADATIFRATLEQERPWYALGRQRDGAARDQLADAVAREPFDPDAVGAALRAMQETMHESARRFDASLVVALGRISPEGRAALAERFRRRFR